VYRIVRCGLVAALVTGLVPSSAGAQSAPVIADASPAANPSTGADSSERGVVKGLVHDVASDYRNFFSVDTATWLGLGGVAALAIHGADDSLATEASEPGTVSLPGGSVYGSQLLQIPVAIAWWAVGEAMGSPRNAEAGRDLLRAQISVFSWTYAIKFATQRERPNGDPRSFPSGHASTSFATAMVLQEHYGWKIGLPAFAAAAYTAASRVADRQHWASDVVFGAALGMVSGRTVTIRLRESHVAVAPVAVPGGVMVTVKRSS
jgi:membrane-associated phospholipid phosphatase